MSRPVALSACETDQSRSLLRFPRESHGVGHSLHELLEPVRAAAVSSRANSSPNPHPELGEAGITLASPAEKAPVSPGAPDRIRTCDNPL